MPSEDTADTTDLLATAVEALGGSTRDGQVRMANAVAHAIDTGEHLAVQAGTGTGKSLAYLVPAFAHATESGKTVVVSTATIALQRQLVERDLPRLAQALAGPLGTEPTFAILKGRSNYLCLNKIHGGIADEPDAELFDAFETSRTGREVTRLREWSSDTETGDRDDLVPGVSDRAWRQVSVTARECLGANNCSYAQDCFAEHARTQAAHSDVVVTNHAMLAIDALSPASILPEHDVVIIDEAHELTDRITAVATDELSAASVTLAARRAAKLIDEELVDDVIGGGELIGSLLDDAAPRLLTSLPTGWDSALASLRDRLWRARSGIGPVRSSGDTDGDAAAARSAAITSLEELHDAAVRVLTAFNESDPAKRRDVVWLAEESQRSGTRRVLRIAPLSVGGLLRASLFVDATVILTSATLVVGGSFDALATTWGLPVAGNSARGEAPGVGDVTASGKALPGGDSDTETLRWRGLDAGSPFDYPRAAILYVARHLPPPGRGGLSEEMLAELDGLISAARGRTLGLFSSMRAAREAADALRERTDHTILCQGEDSTSALVRRFSEEPQTCLFGTLSLWQGVDVPGDSLSLVVIDRIPFPRPDDPLASARARAIEASGGNGFMAVSANHAALLLAQGAGRLLRATTDRGVVAVLDSRLATARYGGYLTASLPPFWRTTERATVLAALDRLTA
ncbi:MAG TPA: ATP-dependent DNA helicase [Gordonia sp. (in: high G+C Gram-positive bacteria)]|uniref:ATP-dependent DNA helicase n=1 Tax=unclassified Gordonia (in: high G+C Gram-positive bacteria) TaxID=2657482 RepID=UPI000FBCD648|nr:MULTISPECIES: ATP-dependent DNA helicase [unclassified Gordonia (in: high G+C Gram-positive bacteria)]RUP40885.1 MAG: ATP-dependent DNA helicase [Gordonia sp. (in: high G+C Gram-positive bacteria)]HNP57707.1 ATP-dependent DNA helicase [Gordonia sp. (in: high G+C Gram-positive bacteria)]HRC51314.1 ATP-dependent DNA helicase [Gordonia sp. (in: high G+C Gram-positive bacteria)]